MYSRPYQPEIASTSPRYLLKGGPEPLEHEINEILGSKREDQFEGFRSPSTLKINRTMLTQTAPKKHFLMNRTVLLLSSPLSF